MFRVAQKVVCVNDQPDNGGYVFLRGELKVGQIYTIRDFVPDHHGDPAMLVRLVEITRRNDHYGFRQDRFRPVVERTTDISIFTKMLTPKRSNARVPS